MPKGSKKQKHKALKKAKAKLEHLSEETLKNLAAVPNDWQIPVTVANVANEETTGELSTFIVSFDHLEIDECVFNQFDSVKTGALVRLLKRVNDCEVNRLGAERIVRDNISCTGAYVSLFNNLSPDIEMKETELPGNGRVFFFITRNRFNIVSIESIHRNID